MLCLRTSELRGGVRLRYHLPNRFGRLTESEGLVEALNAPPQR